MLDLLRKRFCENAARHGDLAWRDVENCLRKSPGALALLRRMDDSGGEPDVLGVDADAGVLLFCDCAKETPAGRRSLCYDDEALRKRAKNPPSGSAVQQARELGVELMTETLYRRLQTLGAFDEKTSSWIATPGEIRSRGGALFCERRYGRVFTFHNGADSYYSTRGWRGCFAVPFP